MADGRRVPIESLVPGDMVRSLSMPGLQIDVPFQAQYEWHSTWGLDGMTLREARVAVVRLGEHDGFYLINRRIKATFEHPFLVRRDEEWGFCSAELLKVGDYLITLVDDEIAEERIDDHERIDGIVRTVAIHIPGTNTYLADGVWTHNDAPTLTSSGSSISSSGSSIANTIQSSSSSSRSSSSKSSGSSFSSLSSSIAVTVSNSTASSGSGL